MEALEIRKMISRRTAVLVFLSATAFILFLVYRINPIYPHICPGCLEEPYALSTVAEAPTAPGVRSGNGVEKARGGKMNNQSVDKKTKDTESDIGLNDKDLNDEGCYKYAGGRFLRSRKVVNETKQPELGCEKRDAKVVLLGVSRCGTEALTLMLDLHPDIVTNFYTVNEDSAKAVDLSSDVLNRVTPMTTPKEVALINLVSLQHGTDIASQVVDTLGEDVKFILILRDPIERALSEYRHLTMKIKSKRGEKLTESKLENVWDYVTAAVKKGRGKVHYYRSYRVADTFEQSIFNVSGEIDASYQIISLGLYDRQIQSILKYTAAPGNLLVLDGQTFLDAPWKILREVQEFLGVSEFFSRKYFKRKGHYFCPKPDMRPDAACLNNQAGGKLKVDKRVTKMLATFYEPHTKAVRDMTGANFTWIP